jgi:hypothetical protein
MPFSWIRVPNHETPLNSKLGSNYTREAFLTEVAATVKSAKGTYVDGYYELNGEWARVLFKWSQAETKKQVMMALAGEDDIDLLKVRRGNSFHR